MDNHQTGFADINGAKIYYETAGTGRNLVMLHAGIADNRMWDDQFSAFGQDYRVIRYDQRNYGQSAPVQNAEFRRLDDLTALLDFLKVDSAIMMGCSMGGGLAIDFTLQNPARVEALILVGSGPDGFEFDEPPPPYWDELVAAFKDGDIEHTAELEARLWFDGTGRTPEQVDASIRQKMIEMNTIALNNEKAGTGKELASESKASTRLSEIRVPTLVIVGDRDTAYLLAAADYMAANIASAQKVVMPNTAHVPSMEYPTEFNRIVRDFLTTL